MQAAAAAEAARKAQAFGEDCKRAGEGGGALTSHTRVEEGSKKGR
jgi:hypothetical protein